MSSVTPVSAPSSLEGELAYIKARREGQSFEGILQEHCSQQIQEVGRKTEECRIEVRNRFDSTKEAVRGLFNELESHDFLQAAEMQNTNLKATIEKMKPLQTGLKKKLETAEEKLSELETQGKVWREKLQQLTKMLNELPSESPCEGLLLKAAEEGNKAISDEMTLSTASKFANMPKRAEKI